MILTAGYGNLGFARFAERLAGYGVTHLVDVRAIPGSRHWKEFCRPELDDLVTAQGMQYVYMGDKLGGTKPRDGIEESPAEVEERLAIGLPKLLAASNNLNRKLCLMCGCMRPENCHRSVLLGERLLASGVDLLHVLDDETTVLQSALPLPASRVQLPLF